MLNVEIGNSIVIEWKISRNGQEEDFTGKALKLYIVDGYNKMPIENIEIKGNILRFGFAAKDQKRTGKYGLELIENDGSENMSTIRLCHAFCLVRCCSTSTDLIELSSEITVPANGLTAYEIAVKNGFEGTEEEWLKFIRQPSEDAALTATKAAETANQAAADAALTEQEIEAAEALRVEAENQRETAETERQQQETAREQAETKRQENETTRQQKETERQTAETARAEAEATRVSSEQERVTAEQERVTAESARVQAEQVRVSAEQSRVQAESARVTAEEGRVSAESAREQAEAKRQTGTAAAVKSAEDAAAAANTAAGKADAAAANAQQVAGTYKMELDAIRQVAEEALPRDEQALNDDEKTKWQKVIAQAYAELYSRADALGKVVDHGGYLRVDTLDIADLPMVCGEMMYMSGNGAPSAPPRVPFQEYYDIDGKKFYKAKGSLPDNPSVSDWIAMN